MLVRISFYGDRFSNLSRVMKPRVKFVTPNAAFW